jgi:hypothetical protein
VQRGPSMRQFDGRLKRLFSQANGTHREIAHFPEVLLRIVDEHFDASFTAEEVLFAVVEVGSALALANSQPDKRAAARGTNWRLHLLQPFPNYDNGSLLYGLSHTTYLILRMFARGGRLPLFTELPRAKGFSETQEYEGIKNAGT